MALSGCANNKQLEPMELTFSNVDATNEAVITALEKLTDSAAVSAEANRIVAQLENGRAYLNMSQDEYDDYIKRQGSIPLGLEKDFDINYTGPLIPLLQSIADTSGYTFAQPAIKPIRELFVSLNTLTNPVTGKRNSNVKNTYDAINAINAVHKDRILITIHEKYKVINLEYK